MTVKTLILTEKHLTREVNLRYILVVLTVLVIVYSTMTADFSDYKSFYPEYKQSSRQLNFMYYEYIRSDDKTERSRLLDLMRSTASSLPNEAVPYTVRKLINSKI